MFGKSGINGLVKEGTRVTSGIDEVVLKNIENCKKLAQITRTSMGPNGMNKMVINHLDKLIVTNDAATILKELEVIHPAAKLLDMASQKQEQEVGDATNFVTVFAGELLNHAEALLKMGLHQSDIITGYNRALVETLSILPSLSVYELKDVKDKKELVKAIKTAVASKQYGREDFLASLVADAALLVMPAKSKYFNVDNVRTAKLVGAAVTDSVVVRGVVVSREVEGTIKHINDAKVVVYSCALDMTGTETKGTVLLKSADELKNYSQSEERVVEKFVNSLADLGVNVIVTGSAVSELILHFCERKKMMVLKVLSKFELRRLCKTTNANPIVRLIAPQPDEIGHCTSVQVQEIGDQKITIFKQKDESSQIATIILRAATNNILDDLDRAVDDAVNVVKQCTNSAHFVAGAGASEMELARRLKIVADTLPGLEQYAVRKFGEACEVVARTLAETSGLPATELISSLYAAHQSDPNIGVNIEGDSSKPQTQMINAVESGILDHMGTKLSAFKLATDAAVTVLRVNQLIMARTAGGPRVPRQGGPDQDDD